MAKVDTSDPYITVTVVSDPPPESDGALTADLLADFAVTLAEQTIPGNTAILCTHAPDGHLGGLWAQAQVPYAPVGQVEQAEPTEADVDAEPAGPTCSECPHGANRHISHNARGQDDVGCRDCACPRSKERVWKFAEAAA